MVLYKYISLNTNLFSLNKNLLWYHIKILFATFQQLQSLIAIIATIIAKVITDKKICTLQNSVYFLRGGAGEFKLKIKKEVLVKHIFSMVAKSGSYRCKRFRVKIGSCFPIFQVCHLVVSNFLFFTALTSGMKESLHLRRRSSKNRKAQDWLMKP